MEPLYDSSTAASKIFNFEIYNPFTAGADTVTISDYLGGDAAYQSGYSQIAPVAGETVIFLHPMTALTLNALAGNDNITINALDSGFNASLTINAGVDNDVVTINAVTGNGSYQVNGEAGDDDIRIGAAGLTLIVYGGEGTGDKLTGPDANATWNLTSANAGSVGWVAF